MTLADILKYAELRMRRNRLEAFLDRPVVLTADDLREWVRPKLAQVNARLNRFCREVRSTRAAGRH